MTETSTYPITTLSSEEIRRIVHESFGRHPLPYLRDPAVREKAREQAARQGYLDRIARDLTPDAPFPVLRRSEFRQFRRTGGRSIYDGLRGKRHRQIELAAASCWFGDDTHLDYLQDLLWAECDDTWWVSPAHEHHADLLDLRSTMAAREFAIILDLLGERMEEEVRTRLTDEIRCRVLETFLAPDRQYFWWKTTTNNWNSVCHGGICIASMLLEKDPERVAATLALAIRDVQHFIDGFTDDGGCSEGPGYWRYGFGWYVMLAEAIYDYTAGRIDLMASEKIERICRFPLATTIQRGCELTFADAHSGLQAPATAVRINRFHSVPELFGLCPLNDDGTLKLSSFDDMLVCNGGHYEPLELMADSLLPDLGVALVRQRAGDVELALGAKSGHNNEHHNHNDVGSFLVYRGGTVFLTDPGGPIYTAKTFSDRRYESVFTNSYGHSTPVINGSLQSPGRKFGGTTTADGLNGDGTKTVTIDFARAYDEPALRSLRRVFEVPPGAREVRMSDTFAFASDPQSVEEGFMSILPCEAAADGRSVTIRSETAGEATLAAAPDTPGRFRVDELVEESAAESPRKELLRRIAFVPDALSREMTLRFTVTF